ncbi:MAG: hypothetical protein HUU49_04730 [Candidatus Buchananbacteria bacterium]|nr:hypothetical protein [Candidatus Buchananbacteria bacterium]
MSLIKIFITAIVVNLVFVGGLLFAVHDISQASTSTNKITPKKVYFSETECVQATNKSCQFRTCDYVPDSKTFEEVCGADFKKGWVPIQ